MTVKIKEEKQRWLQDNGPQLQHTFNLIGANSVIFDIGLYKGDWSKVIAQKYNPYIYGFEPVCEFYQQAQKTLAEYPKVKVFNVGLGDHTHQDIISINNDSSSLLGESDNCETVQIISIKDFMARSGINFVDLVCINIEGAEYALLNFMFSEGLMPKFDAVLLQFHELGVVGCHAERDDIRRNLSLTHDMIYSYDTIWDYWRRR